MTTTTTTAVDALVVAVNVRFVVKPDMRDIFLKSLYNDADQTILTENGNLQFVVGEDVNTPNTFHLHEQYKTLSDYEYHQTTAHFKKFASFLEKEDPLIEPIEVLAYKCQHEPTKITPRSTFCLNVESYIKPEYRDEFIKLMDSHKKCSLEEPLCIQFDYGIDINDDNIFHQHEEFIGERDGLEGYEAHQIGAHFDRFMEFNKQNPYSKSQEVKLFKTIFTS